MPGVKGSGGPPPKRSDQRRRTAKPKKEGPQEITKAPAGTEDPPERPPAERSWHRLAVEWYESLATSGQARFYEPSDWATAKIIAESISRELKPQAVVVGRGQDAHVEKIYQPPRSASLAAWLKGMTALLATEGDRRRAAMELQRPPAPGEQGGADVTWLDDARNRLGGAD